MKNSFSMKEEAQMAIIKNYPHVNVSVDALLRARAPFVESGATTLFVPFIANKGSDKIEKIYNLAQFIDEYGSPDLDTQGRGILNAYNWLTRGGVVYALRLVGDSAAPQVGFATPGYVRTMGEATATNPIKIIAGSKGVAYNNFSVSITSSNITNGTFLDVVIANDTGREVQRFTRLNEENYKTRLESSPYILSFELNTDITFAAVHAAAAVDEFSGIKKLTLTGGTNTNAENVAALNTLIAEFFGNVTETEFEQHYSTMLGNRLEHSIDLILDAGYSLDAKKAIANFVIGRDDIMAIFDTYDFTTNEDGIEADLESVTSYLENAPFYANNISVYSQKLAVNDTISGKEIWVTPTYYLAQLLPANDRTYGLQWPTAGLTRGVLDGVTGIDFNPTNSTDLTDITSKEYLYINRINYIERDARGYRFMSQSTRSEEDTALRFVNNVRVVNRMSRELENLGRNYLFEFNDATTLKNMSNALNRYVGEWIQNRTLSYGLVTVQKNEFSDEKVDVILNIRFTGTIEIISIAITIE
jgi:hypothetical protein